MAQRRPDKAYFQQRILDLYATHTVEEIVEILNGDPQLVSEVTVSSDAMTSTDCACKGIVKHKDKPWTKADHDLMVSRDGVNCPTD
ncbi:hypothetical protein [Alicyclobacillus ferrooxydans]|uniref:hypothetical protein n=1 Tax=Alicyclobacillus ferrooxydans TaxID=471514 RepID=UPI0006D5B592